MMCFIMVSTPSVTTQGMKEPEMVEIARFMARALRGRADAGELAKVRADVAALCAKFPAYPQGV